MVAYIYMLFSTIIMEADRRLSSPDQHIPLTGNARFGNGGTIHPDTGVAVLPWENLDWWIPV
jgi:hypothetical protein